MSALLKIISSLRITVVCIFLLFVLTFWGTLAQVDHGLYAAQERFFNSLFFLAAGFIPFPGAQLVLWVLFFNLIAASIIHFSKLRHWRYAGLKLSHAGLLLYFISAYLTLHAAVESNVHLAEGQETNVSASYDAWELAFWKQEGNNRFVLAVDVFNAGDKPLYTKGDVSIYVRKFYPNASAFTKALPASGERLANASGITLLQERPKLKEREQNIAGAIFEIVSQGKSQGLLLYAGESSPTVLNINNQQLSFQLRHKKYPLPFTLRLDDFRVEFYPGTQIAKSYESFVTVIEGQSSREVHIFMNNPFRYKDLTFYQASYNIDPQGREYSTLAVVKNGWAILPYLACFAVFLGLTAHFLIAAFLSRGKKNA